MSPKSAPYTSGIKEGNSPSLARDRRHILPSHIIKQYEYCRPHVGMIAYPHRHFGMNAISCPSIALLSDLYRVSAARTWYSASTSYSCKEATWGCSASSRTRGKGNICRRHSMAPGVAQERI